MDRIDLPDKLFFKIGEVAELAGIKPHVLRYWETEFPHIKPQKSRSGQRLYRRRDLEAVLAIKHLLYDLKFTIDGARRQLREAGVEATIPPPDPEKVAATVREQAMEETANRVAVARAELTRRHEGHLLELRAEVKKFLEALDKPETR